MSGSPSSAQTLPESHPRHQQHSPHFPQRPPDLSKDEIRVLKECSTESFWFRCVPLSITLVSATQFAVNKGYLTRHPKYGSLLKSIGAGLAGYILGKFSYQGECRKKILALPNSRLADAVRQRKGTRLIEEMTTQVPDLPTLSREPVKEKPLSDVYSGSMDLDSDRDSSKRPQGLDDRQRPTLDNESPYSRPAERGAPPGNFVNYDELRQKNRSDFQQKGKGANPAAADRSQEAFTQRPWPSSPGEMGPPGQHRPSPPPPPKPRQQTGKYGDVWDE